MAYYNVRWITLRINREVKRHTTHAAIKRNRARSGIFSRTYFARKIFITTMTRERIMGRKINGFSPSLPYPHGNLLKSGRYGGSFGNARRATSVVISNEKILIPLVSLAILSFSKNLFINKSIINLNFLRICFKRKCKSCLSRLYYKKYWNGFFKIHCCLCERLRSRGYPIGNDKSSWWEGVSK